MDDTERSYRSENVGVRPTFGNDENGALLYYARFVEFVRKTTEPATGHPAAELLDVGCGSGWSTYAFSRAGYHAHGIDLNERGFEVRGSETLELREGSALDIPYPDRSFDVVASYQVIEHVPDPARALEEMARVTRLGGTVCIAGPNLLSPVQPILLLLQPAMWRCIPLRRKEGMARHPYGNTVGEIVGSTVMCTLQLIRKLFDRSAQFTMRTPDPTPPFHGDNDACYLCNPIDLVRWFRAKGWHIVRNGWFGRPIGSQLLAGGTWIAARKIS